MAPVGAASAPTVFEYDRAESGLIRDTSHKDADDLNHEWHDIVTMQFHGLRSRSQGLMRPETPLDTSKVRPNGIWGAWSKWDDTKAGTTFEIGYLKSEKGVWSMEVGPGLQPSGWLGKVANDLSGSQGAPFYLTVDQIEKAKPASCEALFAMLPNTPPERAPGHSLSDSYKRTQAIAEDNASRGISDTINPSYVRRLTRQTVCYSFDAAGTCRLSGDELRVPGDLEQPLDWNKFLQADACGSPQSAQVEIVLKGLPAQDNRTRIIRCVVASYLAHLRQNLIDLGVKDAPWADIEPANNRLSPPAVPGRSVAPNGMPGKNSVTWISGNPTFKDSNTTVTLARSFIIVQQGSTSARFSFTQQGTGITLIPPPDARSRETYNSQTHQYVNSNPSNGDATGSYPNGPPPGMMAKLGPFVHIAMNAIDQAKQTPDGANWDDKYFRDILKPYNIIPASNRQ